MKSIDRIPTSKIQRAGKLVSTGAKVGVNFLKYYGEKITKTEEEAKENLKQFGYSIDNLKIYEFTPESSRYIFKILDI